MGILDKAKSQLQERLKGIGEETVRVMDAVKDEPEEKQRPEKQKKSPVKRVQNTALKKKPVKNRIVERPKAVEEEPVFEEEVFVEEESTEIPASDESSAFELEDEDGTKSFMRNMTLKHKKKMKEYESVPVPVPDEGKIQDVLEILNIPATFEIDNDIFLPEDLEEVGFDIQVPQGYEMGEVDTFVSRVEVTVKKYVELLRLRNEHVAKLATVVDRLQVDVSNIKFQSEIANGINIMPTNDDEDYEQENLELKLIIKRLEEQLDNQNGVDDTLSSEERETYEKLQDELSLKNRDIKDLEDEVYELKSKLALKDEDSEPDFEFENTNDESEQSAFDFSDSTQYTDSISAYVDASENINEPALEAEPNYYDEINNNESEFSLPSFEPEEFYNPEEETLNNNLYEQQPESNESVENDSLDFVFDEEELSGLSFENVNNTSENFNSAIEVLDDNGRVQNAGKIGTYYDPDDEEDEIERLQNWSNNQ